MDATDLLEQRVLQAIFAGIPLNLATRFAGLFTTSPTDVGTDGVEVSAASYARAPIAPISPVAGTATSVLAVVFPPVLEAWGTITAIGVFDPDGNLVLYETGLSQAIVAGDIVTIAGGALIVTVA